MDKLTLEMNGGSRPVTATAAFYAQVVEAVIVVLYWLVWSFGFGKLPYSFLLSSVIFGLPLTLTLAATRGLYLEREWGWWLSFVTNAATGLCLLAIGSVLIASLFLALPILLLLPATRRYYFTFRL